ncbi:MAG: metal-sensitive transcriptional regulator [Methylorubrum rhodinum]|uniref:metal-sensitive transcriptional regulator n=1 Tax=Methylorubrum rhodinum TaxID=29428 RepID=UPI003BB0790A
MVDGRIEDGRIQLRRSEDEKRPILQRLNRIEGQVRGLRAMIEEDRYCLDEIQQINAVTAALREVALIIVSQHLAQGIQIAIDTDERDPAIEDIVQVLRAAMRTRE